MHFPSEVTKATKRKKPPAIPSPSVSKLLQTSTPILTSLALPGQDALSLVTPDTSSPLPCISPPTKPSENGPLRSRQHVNLWAQAFKILQAREPDLMAAYMEHVPESEPIESIVNRLEDDQEKIQWRVKLSGLDVRIRLQAERLFKFILSNPMIKAAIATQPFANVPWAGASLLLPVRQFSVKFQTY